MLDEENLFCFQIEHIRYEKPLEVGCKSLLQLQEWVETLRESIARLDIIVSRKACSYDFCQLQQFLQI